MTCFFCKGEMTSGHTIHTVELENSIVVIKNVPCFKCEQCGETVFNGEVLKQLDKIIDTLQANLTEVAIVNYPGRVA